MPPFIIGCPFDSEIETDSIHRSQYLRSAYRGHWLGSLLLKTGFSAADDVGAKVHLQSSAAGLSMYVRYKWMESNEVRLEKESHVQHDIGEKFPVRKPKVV